MSRIKRTIPVAGIAILLAAGGSLGYTVLAGPAVASPAVSESTPHHASAHGHHAGPQDTPAAITAISADTGRPPRAKTPEMALRLLGERIAAKDVDGIIALHVREAGLVDFDGSIVRGHEQIRAFYIEFFKTDPILTVDPQQTVIAGGERGGGGKVRNRLGTVMGDYSLELTGPDGTRQSFTGNFCDVLSEQPNGTWLYVHDNPYPPHG